MTQEGANLKILWVGEWAKGSGAVNPRYYELLRRLSSVCKIAYPALRGVTRLERLLMPVVLPRLAHRYRVLFDPGARFTRWWPGPSIVDVDDPLFTPEEVKLLKDVRVQVIVTTTQELALRLSHLTGKEVKVIPSGFSARDIDHKMVSKIRNQQKHLGNPVVGYTSPYLVIRRDIPHQNDISLLLDAMELVWIELPYVELWLIGVPDSNVRAFANAHRSKVKLFGLVSRKYLLNYVCNFDIAVYPRQIDWGGRFSVKLIEFLGCGVPVVANRVSEARIVEEAKAGVVVNSTDDFAKAIMELVKNTGLRAQLGENGRRFAKDYDWDLLAGKYERDVFEPVVGMK